MEYNHLPDCKHPHAPVDTCGCEVKILQAKVDKLIVDWNTERTVFVKLIAELQAKVEELS